MVVPSSLPSGAWLQLAIVRFGLVEMDARLDRAAWQDPFWKIYLHAEPGGEVVDERGRTTLLAPRTIVVLPAWQRWQVVTRRTLEHLYVVVDAPQLPASLVRRHFLGAWTMPDERAWRDRARGLAAAGGRIQAVRAPTLSDACAIQALCNRVFESLLAPLASTTPPPEPVRAALEHLDAHLDGDCRASLLARRAGVGIKSLNAAFRSALGVSAASYVRERRIARAADLLLTSAWGLERIAEAAGFPNRHYLTRVFTRRMGVPPARYRAQRAPR